MSPPNSRYVPERPNRPEPVDCDVCNDNGQVARIRGGQPHTEPCPRCVEHKADWGWSL